MKKLFSTSVHPIAIHLATLLLRVAAGSFMLTHGFPKLQRVFAGEFRFVDPIGLGPELSLILAVFAEFLCSVLIILGFRTRLAVIPLIITMGVAAFISHGSSPFGKKELALLYFVAFMTLFLLGSGKYSVDYLLRKRR